METWYAESVKKCVVVRNVLIDWLESFQNNLPNLYYHGSNQPTSVCRTRFKDGVPGSSHCIANFMDQYSQKLEMVWFFLKTEPEIHERICGLFYNLWEKCDGELLRLDPCNANKRDGKCQKLLLRMICPDNHFHFQIFKNLTEFLKSTSLSTILQL